MKDKLLNINQITHYRNMPDLVAEAVKEAILRGEFKGGMQLKQDEIARKYDVSLIPVREALIQLESKHLVKCIRNKGTIVKTLDIIEMEELFQLKKVLEIGSIMLIKGEVVEQAVDKMELLIQKIKHTGDPFIFSRYDKLFHQLLCDCAENSELSGMYEKFYVRLERYLIYMYHLIPDASKDYDHHKKIAQALKKRNTDILKEEITYYCEGLPRFFEEYIISKGQQKEALDWNIFLPF